MAYELRLQNYEGPLEKLLALIEERKMTIGEVSLAAVTDDFLKHLEELKAGILAEDGRPPEEYMRLIADFIVVASRLILIKSKSLLPDLALTAEEEKDIKDLEERLVLYQSLKGALKHVSGAWKDERRSIGRPYFMQLSGVPAVFHPGKNVNPEEVLGAMHRIYEGLQKFVLETETIEEIIISLEEKMRDIAKRMESATETTLRTLSGGSKADLVVAFLAILHLAREQLVFLEQEGAFSDIIVRKNVAPRSSEQL